jgi:Ca2+-transporting ATPase
VITVFALGLAFWPDADAETRRSLVFSLLLLTGGGLVWLNGDRRSPILWAGVGIGLGLWLLLLAIEPLRDLLAMASLDGNRLAILLTAAAMALGLAGVLSRLASRQPFQPA